MVQDVPIYDNHVHMSPSGRNVDALLEFQAAGGTGITLVTLPYKEIEINTDEDFIRSYDMTLALAKKAREKTDLEINIAVGPYPILLISLIEKFGIVKAEEIMIKGMEHAASFVAEGKACAIGEIGRPHFEVPQEIKDASNRVFLRGMELAKENNCPIIVHCESGSIETNQSLYDMAKSIGLDAGMVVKHSSPPFVTIEETFGIMPSIPASKKNISEALLKGNRFMVETDYIDDPDKPGAVMSINTVPKKIKALIASGTDMETIFRICKDIPDCLYNH